MSYINLIKPILSVIHKYRAVTAEQIAYFLGEDVLKIRKRLSDTRIKKCLNIVTSFKPYIYQLSGSGLRILDLECETHYSSVRALQHICHRNHAIIALSKEHENNSLKLIYRGQLHHLGINPATAVEHCVAIDKKLRLLMIDDGGMIFKRFETAWKRLHKPHKTFNAQWLVENKKDIKSYWSEICELMIIFTCRDVEQVRSYVAKRNIPAVVYPLSMLWEMTP